MNGEENVVSNPQPEQLEASWRQAGGRWQVTTCTSVHLLDFDRGRATRLPGHAEADGSFLTAALRADHAPATLVDVLCLRVGQPMVLLLALRDDGVLTVRETTPVTGIHRLPGGEPS